MTFAVINATPAPLDKASVAFSLKAFFMDEDKKAIDWLEVIVCCFCGVFFLLTWCGQVEYVVRKAAPPGNAAITGVLQQCSEPADAVRTLLWVIFVFVLVVLWAWLTCASGSAKRLREAAFDSLFKGKAGAEIVVKFENCTGGRFAKVCFFLHFLVFTPA
jgi:hypothetical protein